MLELHHLRSNKEDIIERLGKRGIEASKIINEVLAIDEERKHLQSERDDLLNQANTMAKEIGSLFKQGKKEEAETLRSDSGALKAKSKEKEQIVSDVEGKLKEKLYHIPNVPNIDVPAGNTDEDNEIIKTEGDIPNLTEKKGHWEIAADKDIIDFEVGVKITGAGFPVYKGKGAILQRALIQYFLNEAGKAGYTEMQVPIVINEASGYGTGQLPDKEGQMYHIGNDDLYLIPTAEVPLTNIYRDTIVKQDQFPIKMTGYTPCFRREAGSYGKDVKGLNRLHQFDKVEIVQIAHPEQSYKTLIEMRDYIESLIKNLGLPYRVLNLCGGDLGFTAAQTFDFEVFSAGQMRWLEVSSVSNFETYQSNRLKLRFKDQETKKNKLAHTLNGSALALPRIVATLLENNYKDGKVVIPEVLRAYTGFNTI
jgi:seryl-tRNA synthetase